MSCTLTKSASAYLFLSLEAMWVTVLRPISPKPLVECERADRFLKLELALHLQAIARQ